MKTKIEWTDAVWNPVTGCDKVSAGCKNCYAERVAGRFWKDRKFTDVRCHPERLDQPLRWKKPRRVFVNSMSDLFHQDVPTEFIYEVFEIMAKSKQHTFQVLTKRPERMAFLLNEGRMGHILWRNNTGIETPLLNVWLGVSVEDQKSFYERVPYLLNTPAAIRFLSCEPLLEQINLDIPTSTSGKNLIHWVIAGGESGPGARPCKDTWIESIIDQCKGFDIPVFVKQLGSNIKFCICMDDDEKTVLVESHKKYMNISHPKGGDIDEWPEHLRIREFPI